MTSAGLENGKYIMEKITLTIAEAMNVSGLGRSTLYRLFDEGKISRKKCGNRTLILAKELEDYLNNLPANNGKAA